MGSVVWLLRIGALLLAFGAGWSFGRATLRWHMDRRNEELTRLKPGRRHIAGFGQRCDKVGKRADRVACN